jgi:hypothetical protein
MSGGKFANAPKAEFSPPFAETPVNADETTVKV